MDDSDLGATVGADDLDMAAVTLAALSAPGADEPDPPKGPGFLELLQGQLQAIRDGTVSIAELVPSLAASTAPSSEEDAHLVQLHERVKAASVPVTLRAAVESTWPVDTVEPTAEMAAHSAKAAEGKESGKKAGMLVRLRPSEGGGSNQALGRYARRPAASPPPAAAATARGVGGGPAGSSVSEAAGQPALPPAAASKDDWPDVYGERVLAVEVTCFSPEAAPRAPDAYVPITQEMRAMSAAIVEHLRLSMARKLALRHVVDFAAAANVKRELRRHKDEEREREAERRIAALKAAGAGGSRTPAQVRANLRGVQQAAGVFDGTIATMIAEAKAEARDAAAAAAAAAPRTADATPVLKQEVTLTTMKAVEKFRGLLSRSKTRAGELERREFLPLDRRVSVAALPQQVEPPEIMLPPALNLVPPPLPWSVEATSEAAAEQTRNLADAFAIPRTVRGDVGCAARHAPSPSPRPPLPTGLCAPRRGWPRARPRGRRGLL